MCASGYKATERNSFSKHFIANLKVYFAVVRDLIASLSDYSSRPGCVMLLGKTIYSHSGYIYIHGEISIGLVELIRQPGRALGWAER